MPTLDWIFALVLLASLALGIWRGFVFELLSLLSWIAAFILAQWLAPTVAQKLPMSGAGEAIRYAAGFVLVFVVSVMVGGLVAVVTKKLLAAIGLQSADRALGGAFGLLRGTVLLLASTVVIGMTALKAEPWWRESSGAGLTTGALKGLKPVLPQEFGKYLP